MNCCLMVELLQSLVELCKILMQRLWVYVKQLILRFLLSDQVECEHYTLLMLIGNRLGFNLSYLKMIENVLDRLELMVSHPRFRLFFLILSNILEIFLDRASDRPILLSEFNLKLFPQAGISLLLHILSAYVRLSFLAWPDVWPWSFNCSGCHHVPELGRALLVILCKKGDIYGNVCDT